MSHSGSEDWEKHKELVLLALLWHEIHTTIKDLSGPRKTTKHSPMAFHCDHLAR